LSRRDLWEPEGETPSGYPTSFIIIILIIKCTFSNPVSTHDSPTCGDAQFLT